MGIVFSSFFGFWRSPFYSTKDLEKQVNNIKTNPKLHKAQKEVEEGLCRITEELKAVHTSRQSVALVKAGAQVAVQRILKNAGLKKEDLKTISKTPKYATLVLELNGAMQTVRSADANLQALSEDYESKLGQLDMLRQHQDLLVTSQRDADNLAQTLNVEKLRKLLEESGVDPQLMTSLVKNNSRLKSRMKAHTQQQKDRKLAAERVGDYVGVDVEESNNADRLLEEIMEMEFDPDMALFDEQATSSSSSSSSSHHTVIDMSSASVDESPVELNDEELSLLL
jgi:hypothetical protein